jgi:hypothetical protein
MPELISRTARSVSFGVLLLDDALQGSRLRVADDAAVPGRVVHLGGQDGHGVGVGFVDLDEAR